MPWSCNNKEVFIGRSFRDSKGTLHPSNWMKYSSAEKSAIGLIQTTSPASDDPQVLKTSGLSLDQLKKAAISRAKEIASERLSQTDWYVIRASENNEALPTEISQVREAIRTASNQIESTVNSQTSTAAIIGLLKSSYDANGNVTKEALFDKFPEVSGEVPDSAKPQSATP